MGTLEDILQSVLSEIKTESEQSPTPEDILQSVLSEIKTESEKSPTPEDILQSVLSEIKTESEQSPTPEDILQLVLSEINTESEQSPTPEDILQSVLSETKTESKSEQVNKSPILEDGSGKVYFNINNLSQKVTQNPQMITKLLNLLPDETDFSNIKEIYTLKQLDKNSSEYGFISNLFTSTNKSLFTIQNIEKVFNPYLILQYRLKYLEYVAKKENVTEKMLFHGTMKTNLDNICRTNFNWRLNGSQVGTKNGQGVNFAPKAYFSTHYGDTEFNKAMILAKVLIGKGCQGSTTISVPPGDIDTTTDGKLPPQVYVKYDDNTFYPAYIIYYEGFD